MGSEDFSGGKLNMRILVVPMAAMAETSGPSSRCRLLVDGFREGGALVATCMAEDVNYKRIDGVKNYFLDIPMPFGLPKVIATRTFPIAQKLGITAKKTVKSFDQVLQMTGNLDSRYLRKSIDSVRKAIEDFRPDIVYSEFNISAIIAARKERVPLFITVSKPTQHEYANNPRLADGLNTVLRELDLPTKSINEVLRSYKPQFGRGENFCTGRSREQKILLNLAKNPAGFNQNIAAMLQDRSPKDLIIVINDNAQDGRDISWLWDVDFDRLADETIRSITVSGLRALDMQLRLKYAEIASTSAPTVEEAIERRLADGSGNLYVLVNYTALYEAHKYLEGITK